jgi:hypothetical protein
MILISQCAFILLKKHERLVKYQALVFSHFANASLFEVIRLLLNPTVCTKQFNYLPELMSMITVLL